MAHYSTTPNPVDFYSRIFVDAYDERDSVPSSAGFQAFFGRPETGAQTLFSQDAGAIDIDIIRAKEGLAKMVLRHAAGRDLGTTQKNTQEGKFTSVSRKWPLILEEGDLDANDLLFRVAGEQPYQNKTRLERLRMKARRIHTEHMRRISRTFEFLASQSILTGTMPALLGTANPDYIYDFYRNSSNTQAAAAFWSLATTDPIKDLDLGWQQIRNTHRGDADMAVFSPEAMETWIKNPFVSAPADIRRFEILSVDHRLAIPSKFQPFIDGGFVVRGRVMTYDGHEIWIFTYSDQYDNDAGTPVRYMTPKAVLMADSQARCDRYFGPPHMLPMTPQRAQFYREMFGFSQTAPPVPPQLRAQGSKFDPSWLYFDAYADDAWTTVSIRTQTAPIFATTATDAFFVLTDVVA
jgi:hypothetical protein